MKFGVITRAPADSSGGNLAICLDVLVEKVQPSSENQFQGEYESLTSMLPPGAVLSLRRPVFQVGEILICDTDGRELVGAMRKPDKWDVDCEWFDTAEEAVERANALIDELVL